jgi:hypothetical protein
MIFRSVYMSGNIDGMKQIRVQILKYFREAWICKPRYCEQSCNSELQIKKC